MCQTPDEGGKRCAPCTRPRYEALIAAMDTAARKAPLGQVAARHQARQKFRIDGENACNVVANFASTSKGEERVAADVARYEAAGDTKTAQVLRGFLKRGAQRAEVAKETKQALVKAERAARNSMAELVEHTGPVERSLAGRYPELAAMWITEKNKNLPPHRVAAKSNAGVWLRCPAGHEMFNRLNNWANGMDAGRKPYCQQCQPRRAAAFASTQRDLTALVAALSNDPAAFHTLSPALQYSLMHQMGMLSGGPDAMSRQVAMSIVHGDLTLTDVMRAQDFTVVEKKVRDDLGDEDALATLTEADVKAAGAKQPREATLDQVFAAAGVLSIFEEGSDLAEAVLRESVEQMWTFACAPANSVDPDAYATYLTGWVGKTAYPNAQVVLARFLAEFDAVRARPLPLGYDPTRIDEHGTARTLDPTLAQRRFAHLVNERLRFMNFSGTGAGKTLATTLAVQGSGARHTLVVCPNPVIGQWVEEFRQGFPTTTEVHEGLPTGTPTGAPAGVNRVWVANYEAFQGDTKTLHALLDPFAGYVDAIVFDEIHFAKESKNAEESKRRKALLRLTDRAGEANPDLVVIGASATPVVNTLDEAKSLLRLVEGPGFASFPTQPTIRNAARVYQRLSRVGVRHRPTYRTRLHRVDLSVDITSRVEEVFDRLQCQRRANKGGQITPLAMEQALLPEKLPKVIEKIKANASPTVVYTEYTDGIVAPMRAAMEAEGLRVGLFTGQEQAPARRAVLRAFRDGELDVLIGSRPIATGLDGLQHVSHNLIVVSMPWTAAQDDQLVGRFQRHGQNHDVVVDYVLAYAKVGKTTWSYCKNHRQRRINFKRDIANAAVDGILPDGTLDSDQHTVEHAFGLLAKMVQPTAA